jgi:hypothetical protein
MIPQHLVPLFWDINANDFEPSAYPEYTIGRVLEYGDKPAIDWLTQTFPEDQIKRVIREERRLSPRSANFWSLVYGIARDQVAALQETAP